MRKISLFVVSGLCVLIILFGYFSCFTIPEGQRGVILSGETKTILKPGLHFKWPWDSFTQITVNNQVSTFALPLPAGGQSLSFSLLWQVSDISNFLSKNQNSNQVVELLKAETAKLLTPGFLNNIRSPQQLSTGVLQGLAKDPHLQQNGVEVVQVWAKGINLDDATQTKIFSNMKGLAATIGQAIITEGQAQAEQVRDAAEQKFIQAQSTVLNQAAGILGQGNSAAVQTMASLYRQNPVLFKAYVAAKVKLLSNSSGS